MKLEWEAKEGRRGVLTLFVDGEIWRDIHILVFGRHPNLSTEYTTWNELEEHFGKAEYRGATLYALKRLSIKSYLASELQNKLIEHHVAEANAQRVILECQRLGYLNDEEWLNCFVRRQVARKLGPMAIVMKLRAKGISQENAQRLIETLDNGNARRERITHLLATRYRNRDLSDFRSREKVITSLIRKGFSLSDIRACLTGSL